MLLQSCNGFGSRILHKWSFVFDKKVNNCYKFSGFAFYWNELLVEYHKLKGNELLKWKTT